MSSTVVIFWIDSIDNNPFLKKAQQNVASSSYQQQQNYYQPPPQQQPPQYQQQPSQQTFNMPSIPSVNTGYIIFFLVLLY